MKELFLVSGSICTRDLCLDAKSIALSKPIISALSSVTFQSYQYAGMETIVFSLGNILKTISRFPAVHSALDIGPGFVCE